MSSPSQYAALREWTRFAYAAWLDHAVSPPEAPLPADDVRRLGVAPLLHRVLKDRGDPRAQALGQTYRSVAASNLLLFGSVARARDALLARGIVPVLIKGGAFLLRHSPGDVGVRALADLDLLVGQERFDEAFAVLEEAGWRRASPELKYSSRVAPAITLFQSDGGGRCGQLDLHRHLAQWPLVRTFPARVIGDAVEVGSWPVCAVHDVPLVVSLHRARHAFASDARDLFDLAICCDALDDEQWSRMTDDAQDLGLTGALYATLRQATWWFAGSHPRLPRRVAALRGQLALVRAAVLDHVAGPELGVMQRSPWAGPLGRNLGVFPAALHSPLASLVAAAVFLPRRIAEGGRPANRLW
jgi:hypothetical protein